MTYASFVGSAAGGALGYITANMPGAVAGSYLGSMAGKSYLNKKQMKTPSRKRRNSVPYPTPGRTPKRVRTKPPVKKSKGSGRAGKLHISTTKQDSLGYKNPYVRHTVNKKVSFKKKKQVTITSKFRAQVSKALRTTQPVGTWTEVSVGRSELLTTLGGKQKTISFTPNLSTTGLGTEVLFSPAEVLDCASVMFNKKTPSQFDKFNATSFGTDSFDPRTVKIEVISSSYSVVLRNNCRRTMIIQLYEASPKQKQNPQAEGNVLDQWPNSMTNEASSLGTGQSAINLANAGPETLYCTPWMSKPLTKLWNFERHDITLDPGQVHEHVVRGPSQVVYDYPKFWKPTSNAGLSDTFYNNQPAFVRTVFATYHFDLVQAAGGVAGRFGEDTATTSLLFEVKKKFKIKCPEQALGTLNPIAVVGGGTSTVSTQLTQLARKDVYYHKNWNESTSAAVDRVAEQTESVNV